MATGWAAEGAVQDQIDATVKDGVDRAKEPITSRAEPDPLRRMRMRNSGGTAHCDQWGFVYVLPVKMPMIVSLHGSPGTTAAAARIANCAEVLRDIHCFRGTGQYAQGSPAGD
jgi:hypothetical protein